MGKLDVYPNKNSPPADAEQVTATVIGTKVPMDVNVLANPSASAPSAVVTRVPALAVTFTLAIANANRKGLFIFNDSDQDASVTYGATAGLTDFTIRMPPDSALFIDGPVYTGIVDCICAAAVVGAIQVTEI